LEYLEGDGQKAVLMELPRNILLGSNATAQIKDLLINLKLEGKAVVVSDDVTRGIAGDGVTGQLSEAGYPCETFILGDRMLDDVEELVKTINDGGVRFLLGVGGGRPIDVAKYASKESKIPFISVPTAASHDGIVSSRASIQINGVKRSVAAQAPLAVVIDTTILAGSPHRLLASGCGDIISNYSAVLDWEMAQRLRNEPFSSYAAALSKMTAEIIVDNADNIKPGLEESSKLVAKALVSSGVAMSIAGSSRPASGAEHMFSHRLEEIAPKPALHGEQCAVGTVVMMYLHGEDWRTIKSAMSTLGIPTTGRELGIEDDLLVEALVTAPQIRPERYTILGSGISKSAAVDALKRTGIIES